MSIENNPIDNQPLTVAISSRALFDLEESHQVYVNEGLDAYSRYQIQHENTPLQPGEGFNLVTKLLAINNLFPQQPRKVEVILLSRNSGDSGLRVFNSIQHHNIDISRAAFCGGRDPWRYIKAFNSHLFLSLDSEDTRNALQVGVAAATLFGKAHNESNNDELRFAFDGDSVIFSDESERVYQEQGLQSFTNNEIEQAKNDLSGGPFKPFLAALHRLQSEFTDSNCPIRTALVTARSAPAHERVIRTLRNWDIRLDESLFLGGLNKAEFLRSYGADAFFDDQQQHVESASAYVSAAHVPHGITNDVNSNNKTTVNPYAHWRKG